VAGLGSAGWLAIVGLPLYVLLVATLSTQSSYLDGGALGLPTRPTLANYLTVLRNGFTTLVTNTLIVAVVVVAIVLLLAVPVAYVVVRRGARPVFRLFLLGLAIPQQATIIPVYLMISRLNLYDTLAAIILPTAAFAMPVSVLILVGSMRDISEDLYEAMALDGASSARVLWQLVVPLSRAGITTVVIYSSLTAWNGFLFPLILTQSDSNRVLTLGLFNYVGEFGIDIPALLSAVVLSGVPIFAVYLVARRALVNGLMGVGGR